MKYNYSNSASINAEPEAVYEAILLQMVPHYNRKVIVQQDDANYEVYLGFSRGTFHNYRCDSNGNGGTTLTGTAHANLGNYFNAGIFLPIHLLLVQLWLKPKIRKAIDVTVGTIKKISEKG